MTGRWAYTFIPLFLLRIAHAEPNDPRHISLNPQTGEYTIVAPSLGWTLKGKTESVPREVKTFKGKDRNGEFRGYRVRWDAPNPVEGTLVEYTKGERFRFSLRYLDDRNEKAVVFPKWTEFPRNLKPFSYRDAPFSPYTFGLADNATPWLFFDDQARAFVFSPSKEFMVAKMVGDGKNSIGASLNAKLLRVPKNFRQESVLIFANGIGQAWQDWGRFLRADYRREMVKDEADVMLRQFGYWTDNGADYYYNYDPKLGYAETLLALRDRYREAGIPLGYMQLDSWWYPKMSDTISGEPNPDRRNGRLPVSDWNKYGGIFEYRATKDLFPNGLDYFQRKLGLPMTTHGRWIDRESPLRSRYKISGVAQVDPRYWEDVADYLSKSGVTCYEQDWLENIYRESPELPGVVGVADAFIDSMGNAFRKRGMTMQYCMATPRFYLQALKHPNLTTIRTSPDRFEPGKWATFLFGNSFANAVGAYPWADVFKSREKGNMTLAVLSAGPVGTGDALGREDREAILRAARPDGVLVKPDRTIVPLDRTYGNEANKTGQPFLAATQTDHDGYRAQYVFAFPRDKAKRSFTVRPAEFGMMGRSYWFDPETGTGQFVESPQASLRTTIGDAGYAYRVGVPVTAIGVAIMGDLGKIVPTGKQRVEAIEPTAKEVRVRVAFAKGEDSVDIEGVSDGAPTVRGGTLIRFSPTTKRFTVRVLSSGRRTARVDIGPPVRASIRAAMSELLGRWDLIVGEGEESYPSWVEIAADGGQFVGRWGSARPIAKVELNGDKVTFSLPKQYEQRTTEMVFEGHLVDGRLEGTTTFDNGSPATWGGHPAPKLDLTPQHVHFSDPLELIGESMEGWNARWPSMANNWSIQDGMLVNSAVGTDIVSDAKFNDFHLVAEYKYPKGSNSGIYLRGRYEFQIVDDFEGLPNGVGNSGAIYGFLAPSQNAIKAPDEWNRAEITLLGRHVKVVLNGVTVVDGEMPGITGGALDSAEGEPGPILVQGDHGPVTFRKLTISSAVE